MVIYNVPAITGFTEKERKKTFGMAVLFYALLTCSRQENGGKNDVVFLHNRFISQVKINQIDLPFSGMQSFIRCTACRSAYSK